MKWTALAFALTALLSPPAAAQDEISELVARIEADRLRAHVAWLADDERAGRLGGSAEEAESARWIAERFREAGLSPATADEYVQEFPLVDFAVVDRATLRVAGKRLRLGESFRPLDCSAAGEVAGPAKRWAEGVDLEGAVALANLEDVSDPAAAACSAREAGAVALVLTTGEEDLPQANGVLSRNEYDRLRLASRAMSLFRDQIVRIIGSFKLGGMDPEVLLASQPGLVAMVTGRDRIGSIEAGAWADRRRVEIPVVLARAAEFEGLEDGTEVRLALALERRRIVSRNVIGVLPATESPETAEWIAIGAHFDHVGSTPPPRGLLARLSSRTDFVWNGADDNASGSAAILEIARVLAAQGTARRRNLAFLAFGSEEYGLLGSNWYVAHPSIPLERTVAMLNLDMVARNPETPVYVAGTASSSGFSDLLDQANSRLAAPLELLRDDEYVMRSDQASFLARRIPSLFLSTGEHPDYHESSDELEAISLERMTEATRLGAAILVLIDRLETAPAFDEGYLEVVKGQ